MSVCRENELRAAEASRKEKEKKEAEQKQREETEASEHEESSLLEEKTTKLDHHSNHGNQRNGLHTIVRNDDVHALTEDVNDNQVPHTYIVDGHGPPIDNSVNDIRLDMTPENDKAEHPLLAMKHRDSIEKIHFETGL